MIPAHNEERAIDRCLDALLHGVDPGALEVVVVCNGCTDATAARARHRARDVHVVELATASKAAALRAGDAVAVAFPRLYVDADVVLPGASALAVVGRLRAGAHAARAPIRYETGRSTPLVRSYYRARARIPAVMGALWGAGAYGLSASGRARFAEWPDLMADDLWVDRQFRAAEVEIVDCAPVVVDVPRRARDLLHTLRRTYRGKVENRPEGGSDARARGRTRLAVRQLRTLALSGPGPAADALVYAGFAVAGRLSLASQRGRGGAVAVGWERDESSRSDLSGPAPR